MEGMALPPPKIGRRSLPCPPEWNEYIPKKNRHSESVPRCPGYKQLTVIWSAKALGGQKNFFGKNLIIIFSSQEGTLEKKKVQFF